MSLTSHFDLGTCESCWNIQRSVFHSTKKRTFFFDREEVWENDTNPNISRPFPRSSSYDWAVDVNRFFLRPHWSCRHWHGVACRSWACRWSAEPYPETWQRWPAWGALWPQLPRAKLVWFDSTTPKHLDVDERLRGDPGSRTIVAPVCIKTLKWNPYKYNKKNLWASSLVYLLVEVVFGCSSESVIDIRVQKWVNQMVAGTYPSKDEVQLAGNLGKKKERWSKYTVQAIYLGRLNCYSKFLKF